MASKSIKYLNNTFDISYEILNPSAKQDIVFLHGWGSNKQIMKQAFGNYLKDFRHIYIDMPGFGQSFNDIELHTSDYAQVVQEFLKALNSNTIAIAGHSFGGKVATLINPQNLILLSTAGIVEEKSSSIKFKIFMAKFFNSLGLGKITKAFRSKDVDKMNEGMYSTFKNVVNEDFTNHFKNTSSNTMIFWGETDTATSLSSGKKINELIKNSSFISYKQDHYFFLQNAQDICEKIQTGIK